MENLYVVARIDDELLIINKSDLPYIGKKRALEVMCIKIDLKTKVIDSLLELEKHLKFSPWEEIMEGEEREILVKQINNKFSDKDIQEKIVKPLEERKIK